MTAPAARNPQVRVLGVDVDALTVPRLQEAIRTAVGRQRRLRILHVNAHALNLASRHDWLRQAFQEAEIVLCDGAGVQLAARILGTRLPARITYADWLWQLAADCERNDHSLFFLGARPGVATRAQRALQERHPRLRVVGTHHGYFDKSAGSQDNREVLDAVNRASPDILLVGFGMPLQERWLRDNWEHLDARVALTVGAALDYVSGQLRRAPRWMTGNGLEWLGRLLIEPRRLWRRYPLGNPRFLGRVIAQRLRGRRRVAG